MSRRISIALTVTALVVAGLFFGGPGVALADGFGWGSAPTALADGFGWGVIADLGADW